MSAQINSAATGVAESRYAWMRLWTALLAGAVGSVGMWSVVVILPAVQADFGVLRADATLPYTLTMLGFGIGGVTMGRLADRYGIVIPMLIGTAALSAGYLLSGIAPTLFLFALTHLLIGMGASVTFAPMMADLSHWFTKRRGIAVAIAASGNYLAGAIWPLSISLPERVVVSAAALIASRCCSTQTPNSRACSASSNRNTGARCMDCLTTVVFTPPASVSRRMPRV